MSDSESSHNSIIFSTVLFVDIVSFKTSTDNGTIKYRMAGK